jgi:hypothetical protein
MYTAKFVWQLVQEEGQGVYLFGPFNQSASLDTVFCCECVVCVVPWQWCTSVSDVNCQLIAQIYVSALSMTVHC